MRINHGNFSHDGTEGALRPRNKSTRYLATAAHARKLVARTIRQVEVSSELKEGERFRLLDNLSATLLKAIELARREDELGEDEKREIIAEVERQRHGK